ncbi:hypothetical protein AVEN_253889-1 [Araneus ventricosus]|uniref:Uncharacterized protein n=1 Tax=Araneus ventricosus TaxID=182803 RepID=A0A4Y2ML44_ARAVE|nr:hypothetical protein AVEN_253889-1 [Araneus ventricosus]
MKASQQPLKVGMRPRVVGEGIQMDDPRATPVECRRSTPAWESPLPCGIRRPPSQLGWGSVPELLPNHCWGRIFKRGRFGEVFATFKRESDCFVLFWRGSQGEDI